MTRRALVTGAHGFVGRHLVAHLWAAGDEVVELDRVAGTDIVDRDAVVAATVAAAPDVVYHLAGWSDVGGSWTAASDALVANAVGTLHVLDAARIGGAQRVLVVSSADVYGSVEPGRLPITEDHPLRPVSPYAASKVAADFLALQAWLGHGQEVVRVRAFNHLGPGQSEHFVVPALAARIARNEIDGRDDVPVGNLGTRRDYTDVRDVVRAYRVLMATGEPGAVYNVCSGRDVGIDDIAGRLLAMATRSMHLVDDPSRWRPVDVPVLRGDPSRLEQATGWRPEIALDQSLADVLADWRARTAATA